MNLKSKMIIVLSLTTYSLQGAELVLRETARGITIRLPVTAATALLSNTTFDGMALEEKGTSEPKTVVGETKKEEKIPQTTQREDPSYWANYFPGQAGEIRYTAPTISPTYDAPYWVDFP